MAYVAQEAGADAVSLVNTFVALAIDVETRKPRIANVTAGLSGPAIKPIAVRMVYEASKSVQIPVIGMGGISTAVDVIEFMLAERAPFRSGPPVTGIRARPRKSWAMSNAGAKSTKSAGSLS